MVFSLSPSLESFGQASGFRSFRQSNLLFTAFAGSDSRLLAAHFRPSASAVRCNRLFITPAHKVRLIGPIVIVITDRRGTMGKVRRGFEPGVRGQTRLE